MGPNTPALESATHLPEPLSPYLSLSHHLLKGFSGSSTVRSTSHALTDVIVATTLRCRLQTVSSIPQIKTARHRKAE